MFNAIVELMLYVPTPKRYIFPGVAATVDRSLPGATSTMLAPPGQSTPLICWASVPGTPTATSKSTEDTSAAGQLQMRTGGGCVEGVVCILGWNCEDVWVFCLRKVPFCPNAAQRMATLDCRHTGPLIALGSRPLNELWYNYHLWLFVDAFIQRNRNMLLFRPYHQLYCTVIAVCVLGW